MIAALLLSTAAHTAHTAAHTATHAAVPAPGTVEETKNLPGFGATKVYRPSDLQHARGVVLFISGDGGWNLGVVDMARRIAPHAIVAGISMPAWQKRIEAAPAKCWYPAGELETAAQALEKQYKLPAYTPPILVGYSSGATVVYGAMAQAPPTTFTGAVSLGFCPDLEVARSFCGKKGWAPSYDAKKHLGMLPVSKDIQPDADGKPRWIALQGLIDEVCSPPGTIDFVRQVPGGAVVQLEKVGHGFSVPARWGAAFDRSVDGLLEPRSVAEELHPPATSLGDLNLPLEVVWPESPRAVLIFLSGDGGWADLDSSVARALSQHGIAVVGWSSLRYFWSEKTPETVVRDLERVRAALPQDLPVFAGGYSFGAEVVPVVVKRRAEGIAGLVLIAPSRFATFEVSPLDWLRSPGASDHPVDKAVDAASPLPVLCLVPSEDGDTGCPKTGAEGYERGELPGGHHFGGAYEELAAKIAGFVEKTVSR